MDSRRNTKKYLFESPSVLRGEEEELKRSDFEFEKRLGNGAFGQVWRVKHKASKKVLGVKIVPKDKVMKMLPQFKREVCIMYELHHPHIIKLFNHFEDDKYFYLIMEVAEGGNMFSKLSREKHFMERVAAQYFREVVLAVEYLHSHVPAIIHRDIKPENILIDKEGRVKLTDFGWSNYYDPEGENCRNTVCGTLEYLPPEMVNRKNHDTSADIWCLGVLLYEMLAGNTPFKSCNQDMMLNNISKLKPKFPMAFPPAAKDLVSKMLQKIPTDRLNIKEVKEHRWLMENMPIRETITQDMAVILLPEINVDQPEIQKGYIVINDAQKDETKQLEDQEKEIPKEDSSPINTKNEQTDSLPGIPKTMSKEIKMNLNTLDFHKLAEVRNSCFIEGVTLSPVLYAKQPSTPLSPTLMFIPLNSDRFENPPETLNQQTVRESVQQVLEQVKLSKQVSEISKQEVDKSDTDLQDSKSKLAQLNNKLQEKLALFSKLSTKEKDLQAQISVHDQRINSIHLFNNQDQLSSQINSKKSKLMELISEIKRKQKYLDSIHKKIYADTCSVAQKEKTIQNLQYSREKLRKELNSAQGENRSVISELEINADVLKTRLNNMQQFSVSKWDKDAKIVSNIIKTMQDKVSSIRGLADTEIAGRIESIREHAIDKEQKLTDLAFHYEDMRCKLVRNCRKEKESIILDMKERVTLSTRNTQANIELVKKELRDELSTLIEEEQKIEVDMQEIEDKRRIFKETQLECDAFENEVLNVKKQMNLIKDKLKALNKKKEEKESEVARVKISNPQPTNKTKR